jgi:UDP-N-acetylglucosamine--N-acetylmuramyl-(pentapeptide) pyrophosphoryl-undecaprenol N-acetylglucosamine transferase
MAALFQRATLAVSRAGAGTLTELAITHTPSILIPYPFAAEDHQTYNAKVFAGAGAAWMFQQKDLTADLLGSKVLYLLQSPQQLQQMAQATATVAITNSAEQLGDLIRKVVV